ncbi:MAG: nucleoside deaminase [Candidatus Phytoplasma stylosanthis]|nr:nucleoside deaminase [Candidatus Phytoplasma stylosanthis]MDV3170786.1 nucleoside deaminase [Candidatus Phytoplasma stylosanthis]MDV3174200.1 nucleoside deaminase [Candidatus Phytoplasma stylosanthis]MDV3202725.1 nucleoside deaminase [Candidatus Phytoplasma stylosanthis]
MTVDEIHLFFMKEALRQAKKAFSKNEVPVGTVAVLNNKIVARSHNNIEKSKLFFSHAEFLILVKLNKKFKNYKFLNDIIIYTTLEPCMMCTGALIQARVRKIYYSASNKKLGFLSKISFFSQKNKFYSKISFNSGLLENESKFILKKFFLDLRKK